MNHNKNIKKMITNLLLIQYKITNNPKIKLKIKLKIADAIFILLIYIYIYLYIFIYIYLFIYTFIFSSILYKSAIDDILEFL